MQYTLPNFTSSTASIGTWTGSPRFPIRLISPANLSWSRRPNGAAYYLAGASPTIVGTILVLLPALTDVRGPLSSTGADCIIIPNRAHAYYLVRFVDDFNKGTPVEFRGAICTQLIVGTPMN